MEGNKLCCFIETTFTCEGCGTVWCPTCCEGMMRDSSHRWLEGDPNRNHCPVAGEVRVLKYRPNGQFVPVRGRQ